jgi:hypothetical protein
MPDPEDVYKEIFGIPDEFKQFNSCKPPHPTDNSVVDTTKSGEDQDEGDTA